MRTNAVDSTTRGIIIRRLKEESTGYANALHEVMKLNAQQSRDLQKIYNGAAQA